ncbi:ribbon-helix-helix protein, CopG family [Bacillus smithii]|uniref:ribbon-helix-helix protein, CopG family n=1 Tax=Bacillus smithii TaxID=1479 RepID=UPI002E1BDFC7|nr:ribbon-helix-helix protein, CopG family [Bacillus smithii]MED4928448.1 ribbon-helix-helix protein, CopG family [Bacillus smithii]
MDIKIRKLNPAIVRQIDELAKEKNLSREEYLRRYISNLSVVKEMKEQQQKYEELLQKTLEVIQKNTIAMNRMINLIDELMMEELE